MLDKQSKIYVAGHNGIVGRNHKELDSDCSGGRTAMQFDTASQNTLNNN